LTRTSLHIPTPPPHFYLPCLPCMSKSPMFTSETHSETVGKGGIHHHTIPNDSHIRTKPHATTRPPKTPLIEQVSIPTYPSSHPMSHFTSMVLTGTTQKRDESTRYISKPIPHPQNSTMTRWARYKGTVELGS